VEKTGAGEKKREMREKTNHKRTRKKEEVRKIKDYNTADTGNDWPLHANSSVNCIYKKERVRI